RRCLRADQAGAADDDDPHGSPSLVDDCKQVRIIDERSSAMRAGQPFRGPGAPAILLASRAGVYRPDFRNGSGDNVLAQSGLGCFPGRWATALYIGNPQGLARVAGTPECEFGFRPYE